MNRLDRNSRLFTALTWTGALIVTGGLAGCSQPTAPVEADSDELREPESVSSPATATDPPELSKNLSNTSEIDTGEVDTGEVDTGEVDTGESRANSENLDAPSTEDETPAADSSLPPSLSNPSPSNTVEITYPAAEKPDQIHPPQVVMSQQHEVTCLVNVGEMFPEMTLPDVQGKKRQIKELLGEKLSVILFWNSESSYSREQFSRFKQEVTDPFAGKGVAGIAVNVGDSADKVKSMAGRRPIGFPCLFDESKEAFAQIATEKLPRVYLLDSAGRILWFDIEYSGAARRDLRNAIWHSLTAKSRPDNK